MNAVRRLTVALTVAVVASAAASADAAPTSEETCALLTTADVQRAFPGAAAGQVNRTLEKRGLFICVWTFPTGRLQVYQSADAASESPREEARSWTSAFLDPLKAGAERNVRIEKLPGVGDDSAAIVEPRDAAKGFTQNGVVLVVRKGQRQILALANGLPRPDRAAALAALADLGKALAARVR